MGPRKSPDCATVGVGAPLTVTVKAKGAPPISSRPRARQRGGVLDALTTSRSAQRSALPVERSRAEKEIKDRPVLRGSPDSAPYSPPRLLAKLTPAGNGPVQLMLPVDGALTVGLGTVRRKASPFTAL
jgi:hypothetical protein